MPFLRGISLHCVVAMRHGTCSWLLGVVASLDVFTETMPLFDATAQAGSFASSKEQHLWHRVADAERREMQDLTTKRELSTRMATPPWDLTIGLRKRQGKCDRARHHLLMTPAIGNKPPSFP